LVLMDVIDWLLYLACLVGCFLYGGWVLIVLGDGSILPGGKVCK
ncbi:7584_t:CDS:2, partial [Acaulospora morrowiae]